MLSEMPNRHESSINNLIPLDGPWAHYRNLTPAPLLTACDRRTFERGVSYFENERVRELAYDESADSFKARVVGSNHYDAKVQASGAGFNYSCTCPAYAPGAPCKHIVASTALIFFLTRGSLMGKRMPSEKYLLDRIDDLKDSVDPTPTKKIRRKNKKPLDRPAINVAPDAYGYLKLKADFEPDDFPTKREYTQVVRNFNYLPNQLSYYTIQSLPQLRQNLDKCGFDTQLPLDDGRTIRLKREEQVDGQWMALVDIPSWEVHVDPVPRKELGEDMYSLTTTMHLASDGTLYTLDDNPPAGLARKLLVAAKKANISNYFYRPKDGHDDEFGSIRSFNGQMLLQPLQPTDFQPPRRGAHIPLLIVGEDPTQINKLKPPPELRAKVDITKGQTSGMVEVAIEIFSGDHCLYPNQDLLNNFKESLCNHSNPRLMGAKGRKEVLMNAVRRLYLASSKKDAATIKREAAADSSFERLRLQSAAKGWLDRMDREWNPPEATCLQIDPEKGWCLAKSPARLLGMLLLGMFDYDQLTNTSSYKKSIGLPRVELNAFLKQAGLVCQAAGAELTFDEKAIESAPVSISVEASESDEIDWFELKAEVRCGELTIDQSQWEALIRGELLLENAEGRLVIPHLEQQDAMEALRELFGTAKKKSKRSSKADEAAQAVPRLQMLDWLALRQAGATVKLPAEAEALFQSLFSTETLPEAPAPQLEQVQLRDYQRRGYDWLVFLYQHRFGACLADDMGLGKTLQAACFLNWATQQHKTKTGRKRRTHRPHLIVLPPSLTFNWANELRRFFPDLKVAEYVGGDRLLDEALQADIILTTYGLVHRDIDFLEKHRFDIVVFDEAQALKNIAAARTRAASRLKRQFTVCLTGTPMENHAGEYYSILHLALPGIFGKYDDFRKKMREGSDRLLRRARPFVLRRTKEAILKELPPKVESETYLEFTAEQKEIYTRTVAEVRAEVLEAYSDKTKAQAGIVALAALTRLRQVCISPELLGKPLKKPAPKIEFLLEKMKELQDEGHCALIFSQFARTLDLVETAAKKAKLNYVRLDGKTPTKKRKELVETFQNGSDPCFFLISLKAGGVGLNLTRAAYVIHVDPWWNPAVENQASDRAHRIGQSKTVFIQRLLMQHSVEEKIMQLKERKQKLFEDIVGSTGTKPPTGTLLTKGDFEYLLEGSD